MESFIKKIFRGESDEEVHKYFVRFGKGDYKRRFLISLNKVGKIKLRASFELANDFVNFVKENKDVKFSGKILTKEKVPGKEGRKKSGYFVYEISESSIEKFEDAYFYLLNVEDPDIVLKIKKKLPRPGKKADKIDDKFCSLDLDKKYWPMVKDAFFWDVPENVKKVSIEHELIIDDIIFPEDVDNPVKIRELAKRKGKIIRMTIVDGKEKSEEKEFVI
ncbi:MAG: hypothetical protein IIA87_02350 [Nanoarchaeota archaeon]|nr:hypothetical protein [Nanoarchaeota archaeon]